MHYKDGTEVKVGDVVTITSKVKVTSLYNCEEYCNVEVLIGAGQEHGPRNVTSKITLNTHQIELVERGT